MTDSFSFERVLELVGGPATGQVERAFKPDPGSKAIYLVQLPTAHITRCSKDILPFSAPYRRSSTCANRNHESPVARERFVNADICKDLLDRYGPLIGARDLFKVLGFPSAAALRQARSQGTLPIRTFRVPKRRGNFAYTAEVASWLDQAGKEQLMPEP